MPWAKDRLLECQTTNLQACLVFFSFFERASLSKVTCQGMSILSLWLLEVWDGLPGNTAAIAAVATFV